MRPLTLRGVAVTGRRVRVRHPSRRVRRVAEVSDELGRAEEMLRAMGMAHWLPEAEGELAAVTMSARAPSG